MAAIEANRSKKDFIIENFLSGILQGLGGTIGLGIMLLLIALLAKYVNLVPFFGKFASDIVRYVLQNNPQLIK